MRRERALALAALGSALAAAAILVAAGSNPWSTTFVVILAAAPTSLERWPRATAVAMLAAAGIGAVAPAVSAPMNDVDASMFMFLTPVSLFFAGRRAGGPLGYAAALAVTASATASGLSADPTSFVPFFMPAVAGWAAGLAVRSRDQLTQQLAERAAEIDAEREIYAELSVRYERARIAAELHDIVAHAISLMVVQAGAGQRLAAGDPARTVEAFGHIADAARQAQADMERLVALLADEEEDGTPPDFELVGELVRRAQGSGLNVALRLEGERQGFPGEVTRCAYLVAREGLTNALRYASGAAVEVLVDGGQRELLVEVRNGPPAGGRAGPSDLGGGTGLRGLRERLLDVNGRLDAGPSTDGGWIVRATLPRSTAVAH